MGTIGSSWANRRPAWPPDVSTANWPRTPQPRSSRRIGTRPTSKSGACRVSSRTENYTSSQQSRAITCLSGRAVLPNETHPVAPECNSEAEGSRNRHGGFGATVLPANAPSSPELEGSRCRGCGRASRFGSRRGPERSTRRVGGKAQGTSDKVARPAPRSVRIRSGGRVRSVAVP